MNNNDEIIKKIKDSPSLRRDFERAQKKVADNLLKTFENKQKQVLEIKEMIKNKGRRKFIEDSVTIYRSDFNSEYVDHVKEIHKLKKKQLNKHSSTKDNELRHILKLPQKLTHYLNNFLEPKFPRNDKELFWFAKKFKEFCVAEKI